MEFIDGFKISDTEAIKKAGIDLKEVLYISWSTSLSLSLIAI
jgi:predicted unusual protein kinase regulating ubiquinone biosynthesis (AarF/ABC1/UbiB family)